MGLFKRNTVPEEVKLDEIDRESKYKLFSPLGDKIIMAVLTAWAIFQLYASIAVYPPGAGHLHGLYPLSRNQTLRPA